MKAGWKKTFYISAGAWLLIVTTLAFLFYGWPHVLAAPFGMLLLLAGFKITELLVAVFTKVRSANATAIGLLFLAKIAWWASLFIASRYVPEAALPALAIGFSGFIGALFTLIISLYGLPKISPVKQSGDS